VGTRGDAALDQWVTDKLGRYMRRDMASPDDQFVKAAEQGRPLHFMPGQQPAFSDGVEDLLPYTRKAEGFNPKGEATTPYGKAVESQVDMAVEPIRLEDFVGSEQRLRPQVAAQIAAEPERRIYEVIDSAVTNRLQFPELVTTIQGIRENNTLRAYGQSIPIPKEFQFSDEALKGLSPAQASERVAAYNNWAESARQKIAAKALTENKRINSVKMQEGYVGVEIPDTEINPEILELVTDAGCGGGWCTKTENYALEYGSGNNRLHMIVDKKAQPRAQLTVSRREPNPDDFLTSLNDRELEEFRAANPNTAFYGDVAATPEYQAWAKSNPPSQYISEIKLKNNNTDFQNSPELPAIQEYIKKLDAQNNFSSIDNLEKLRMFDVTRLSKADTEDVFRKIFQLDLKVRTSGEYRPSLTPNQAMDALIKKNQGSKFVVNDDFKRLLDEVLEDHYTIENKASGGMVERRADDSRKYL
jgi:hypothetical protein